MKDISKKIVSPLIPAFEPLNADAADEIGGSILPIGKSNYPECLRRTLRSRFHHNSANAKRRDVNPPYAT